MNGREREVREENQNSKLKRANAEMASSATTSFDSLPDELVLKIVKLAAWAEYEDVG